MARISASGSTLEFSSFLGGESIDEGDDIDVDSQGNAYVVGRTRSRDFPTMAPIQPAIGSGFAPDAFVAKVSPAGALDYSTFLGGGNSDEAHGVVVDRFGYATVAGGTSSFDFPLKNALQSIHQGAYDDAFVSRIGPVCTLRQDLSYSTGELRAQYDWGGLARTDWTSWLVYSGGIVFLGTVELPVVDPPLTTRWNISFPSIGYIGILSLMTASVGGETTIVCADWDAVDTGGVGLTRGEVERLRRRGPASELLR